MSEATIRTAVDVAERIRKAVIAHNFMFEGKKLDITISGGVAEVNKTTEVSKTLIDTADKALYKAKQSGRNKICS